MTPEYVIPRIERPDPAEFRRRFLARSQPVVLTGAGPWTVGKR